MKFYETNKYLIKHNPDTGVYRIANFIGIDKDKRILTKEQFNQLESKSLSKSNFNQKLNKYFRETEHEWIYDGIKFRKLDNFSNEVYGNRHIGWTTMPKHNPYDKLPPHKRGYSNHPMILVYNQGRIYYFNWSYGGYEQGQLYDPRTLEFAKWARPKNCAPIFNCETKEII